MTDEFKKIEDALREISAYGMDYGEWCYDIGMALHDHFHGDQRALDIWDEWSMETDPERFHEGECAEKWADFKEGGGKTIGSFWHAVNKYKASWGIDPRDLEWEGELQLHDIDYIPQHMKPVPVPKKTWLPLEDLRTYIEALFDDEDIVQYVLESKYDEKRNKYRPNGKGGSVKAGDLIKRIDDAEKQYKGTDIIPGIESVLGTYDKNAGAWIRFNPFDGQGVKDENITSYRYTLVESDDMDIDAQYDAMMRLQLPIAALVHSGGKSLHAIVHVDARNEKQYRERVNIIHTACTKRGMLIDKQNRNPSRMSRIPGAVRGDNKQYLIEYEAPFSSYEQWEEWYQNNEDNLPEIQNFGDVMDDLPDLAPELIQDVLRVGHKMLISGGSKTGKSMLLIQLAIAIASGGHWLGMKCEQGKVLYVNMEIDPASFDRRIKEACDKRVITKQMLGGNLHIWNLRGHSLELGKLVPKLIRRCLNEKYSAIIIDPIYKVMMGDENKAGDMALFCNEFDKIAESLKCSVIYAHHFAKGEQKDKASIDRASGSGVFARDPDAILTVTSIESDCDDPAVRVEFTLREFADRDPINAYYRYPIHVMDDQNKLTHAKIKSAMPQRKSHDENLERFVEQMENTFSILEIDTAEITQPMLYKAMQIERTKFIRMFDEAVEYGLTDLRKDISKHKENGTAAIIYRVEDDD